MIIHEAGGIIFRAHPFRVESYAPEIQLCPELVDGVEGINAAHSNHRSLHHKHKEYDNQAVAYANAHGLPMSAGSDIHTTNLFGGGVAFKRRMRDIQDLCRAILTGDDYVLTNGDLVFDKHGNMLY